MADKSSTAAKKAARAVAEKAAMIEVRHATEKQRANTERLKKLRLERDAALPEKKKPAPRKAPKSDLNLSVAQKRAKNK